ncbi:hypothetical protein GuL6_173 [Buttiauxella phage vB_ButM_GuL6]|nr:hypothetical protein GuL6_173 [Buttiauxella phage vB_ButM_GuL6]
MALSKITINFAAKRNILVEICEADEIVEMDRVWIYTDVDACEPDVSYVANADGSFSFYGNLGLPVEVKEELPAYIRDEKHLREVIAFIANEMKGE